MAKLLYFRGKLGPNIKQPLNNAKMRSAGASRRKPGRSQWPAYVLDHGGGPRQRFMVDNFHHLPGQCQDVAYRRDAYRFLRDSSPKMRNLHSHANSK